MTAEEGEDVTCSLSRRLHQGSGPRAQGSGLRAWRQAMETCDEDRRWRRATRCLSANGAIRPQSEAGAKRTGRMEGMINWASI